MTAFNWKRKNENIIRGCICMDRNNCVGCSTREEHIADVYQPPMTNYDRLIRKSQEELAEIFTDIGVRTLRLHKLPVTTPVIEQAKADWLEWLKQETTNE